MFNLGEKYTIEMSRKTHKSLLDFTHTDKNGNK